MKKMVGIKHAKDGYVAPRIYEKTPQEMFKPRVASNCEVNRTHVFRVKRQTVAIVVVPGVMASRLSNLDDEPVWDPDTLKFMAKSYFLCAPEKRYNLLFKNGRKVMAQGDPKILKKYPKAEERGWTGLAWDFFGKLLGGLHDWKTPLKVFLDLPVYAFGFDWVDSCRNSGKALQEFIMGIKADKVIIISHSMGGLVTRYALAGEGGEALAKKVLGVVHGAQPVHGAPDAYHRAIAGTGAEGLLGRVVSEVLGPSGPHMTAIMPHAPGVLQLLPNQFYQNNRGEQAWLHIQDLDDPKKFTSYPKNDPYEEIYSKSHHKDYWGLIHGEWFQPHAEDGETIEKALGQDNSAECQPETSESIACNLKKRLIHAKEVHDLIGPYSHPRTIQLFSNGEHTTITEVCWLARDITQHVLDAQIERYSREDEPLRYLKDLNCVPDFNRFGKYGEVRWREAGGALGDVVPGNALLFKLQKRIREQGLRLYLLRMSAAGEEVSGLTDDPLRHQGDGTVPLSSATAMDPEVDDWGKHLHLLPLWFGPNGECRLCTGQANHEVHASFFADRKGDALAAVKRVVHNLCIGWLKGDYT
jgi:hypothetical protein